MAQVRMTSSILLLQLLLLIVCVESFRRYTFRHNANLPSRVSESNSELSAATKLPDSLPFIRGPESLVDLDSSKFHALTADAKVKEVTIEELRGMWAEKNGDADFDLDEAVHLVTREDRIVKVVYGDEEEDIEQYDDIVVEEEDLRRHYINLNKVEYMNKYYSLTDLERKKVTRFNLTESLLLAADPEDGVGVQSDSYFLADEGESMEDLQARIEARLGLRFSEDTVLEEAIAEEDVTEYVITDTELQRLWADRSRIKWGMANTEFDMKTSLLLLDDEEDEVMDTTEYVNTMDNVCDEDEEMGFWRTYGEAENSLIPFDDYQLDFELTDEPEVVERDEDGFDISSLRGLSDGFFDDEEGDFDAAALADVLAEEGGSIDEATEAAAGDDEEEYEYDEDDDGEPSDHDMEIQQAIKSIHDWLEDRSYIRPAWKKNRHILSPDIDTQNFMGNMMHGNTILTQKIPANWEDHESTDMSETYLSTNTMNYPGTPIIDYNIKIPIWEIPELGCQEFSPSKVLAKLIEGPMPEKEDNSDLPKAWLPGSQDIFAKKAKILNEDGTLREFEPPAPRPDPMTPAEMYGLVDDIQQHDEPEIVAESHEVDTDAGSESNEFDLDDFDLLLEGGSSKVLDLDKMDQDMARPVIAVEKIEMWGKPTIEEVDDYMSEDAGVNSDEMDEKQRLDRLMEIYNGIDESIHLSTEGVWSTPRDWLTHPDLQNHTNFQYWSTQPEVEYHAGDEMFWDEDISYGLCAAKLNSILECLSRDNLEVKHKNNELRYWERLLEGKLLSENLVNETIPPAFVPDKDRGIVYGNEMIEMKGKATLKRWQPSIDERYANDTFGYNEDFDMVNQIGSCRDQLNWWQEYDEADFEIESEVVDKIQPLLDFVGQAAILKSTKNNVLVFKYMSRMRHIIGVEGNMRQIAMECFPEMEDLKIYTQRLADRLDLN